MATTQTTYSETQPIGQVGALANSENWNALTRTADGNIGFGQPVVRTGEHTCNLMSARAQVAVGANGVPAPAGATITAAPTTTKATKLGVHTFVCITAGATGKWRHEDPDGDYVGVATTGSAYSGGGLGLTITDSGTDPAVGEVFIVTVADTNGGQFLGIAKRDITVVHSTVDRFEQYDNVPIFESGCVFVIAGATVAAGQKAYWDEADGRYTNVATDYEIPGATFDTAGADGDIVVLRLRKAA